MNAIIMAAGSSSRFVPISLEKPKGLLEVKGEVLIERQIRQLKEAGVEDITVVTGYKARAFEYLREVFGVSLIHNEDYNRYNNTSSVIRVIDRLANSFLCCSDHYFSRNVFLDKADESYYAARYAKGQTVALYFIFYSLERFFVEALRTDSLMIGPFKQAQVISLCAIILGILLYRYASVHKRIETPSKQ